MRRYSTPSADNADNMSLKSEFIDGFPHEPPRLERERPNHFEALLGRQFSNRVGWFRLALLDDAGRIVRAVHDRSLPAAGPAMSRYIPAGSGGFHEAIRSNRGRDRPARAHHARVCCRCELDLDLPERSRGDP